MSFVTPESYGPTPPFTVESIELTFYLDDTNTKVCSRIELTPQTEDADLKLNGEEITLESLTVNGSKLNAGTDFTEENFLLTIPCDKLGKGKSCIEIVNFCNPTANTALSGLYKSDNLLTTQCEAEGFRRITYFIDRPDVMSKYKVTIHGDKTKYPVLLSNGNLIDSADSCKQCGGNCQMATFEDPFKKPSYLFALIAGPLGVLEDSYEYTEELPAGIEGAPTGVKGKKVKLYCYAESQYLNRCKWALECVKKAMSWDFNVWHRVYDLDRFSIVCISDFNAGAMENKSLTTYNISCILGCKDSATDGRLQRICSVIGHEYFHNWSGNRVTVESWFNITLKEGLTNFREQEFDRATWSSGCKRIEAVKSLRTLQFPEDSSPLAHPICPKKYQSVDNFYTMTVYEKGSEVIGMIQHLVGKENFRKGTDHYFAKYDGKAVNYHHFASAIFEASGWSEEEAAPFFTWYHQKGTPRIQVKILKKEGDKVTVSVKQCLPNNAAPEDETDKAVKPYLFPFVVGVIGKQSRKEIVPTQVFKLQDFENIVVINGVTEDEFVLSTNRTFACPVIMENSYSDDDLAMLLACDTDDFNRWDAGQELMKKRIMQRYNEESPTPGLDKTLIDGIQGVISDESIDEDYKSLALSLPTASEMEALMEKSDPIKLCKVIRGFRDDIGAQFQQQFEELFTKLWNDGKDELPWKSEGAGRRSLRNRCLAYISSINELTSEDEIQKKVRRVQDYSDKAQNYNDKAYAFAIQSSWPKKVKEREEAISKFYDYTQHEDNLLNDWFATIASSATDDALERVEKLRQHPRYVGNKNNNRFRSLAGAFSRNLEAFHDCSGMGYKILAEEIATYDKINPYTSALVCKQMVSFGKYSEERKKLIKEQLEWLKSQSLSKNTEEIVLAGLNSA